MSEYDNSVGRLFHDYVFPYTSAHGDGATVNKFFPVPGSSDWVSNALQDYKDFFTLPNNERYYEKVIGFVHFFFVDSSDSEPDGNTVGSKQAEWIRAKMLLSTAKWKVVVLFDAPYSKVLSKPALRWPFKSWGADMVISGSAHNYERFDIAGLVVINNGLGGNSEIESSPGIIQISGAGYAPINGTVTPIGELNGMPVYGNGSVALGGTIFVGTGVALLGNFNPDGLNQWNLWFITDGVFTGHYTALSDSPGSAPTPDLITVWEAPFSGSQPGDIPPPLVEAPITDEFFYAGGYGAGKLTATDSRLLYEFMNLAGTVVDSIQLTK